MSHFNGPAALRVSFACRSFRKSGPVSTERGCCIVYIPFPVSLPAVLFIQHCSTKHHPGAQFNTRFHNIWLVRACDLCAVAPISVLRWLAGLLERGFPTQEGTSLPTVTSQETLRPERVATRHHARILPRLLPSRLAGWGREEPSARAGPDRPDRRPGRAREGKPQTGPGGGGAGRTCGRAQVRVRVGVWLSALGEV